MITLRSALRTLSAAALAAVSLSAWSDDAAIRKAWAERYPNLKPIDQIEKTPIPGLFELRAGGDFFYSDDQGNYIIVASRDNIEGHVIDTRTKSDVTEQHMDQMMAADMPKLPYKDAIVRKFGNGSRRLVVFEDPNCHFCKDVEKNLIALKDVTIYTFLIPILGPDSVAKSRDIWCSSNSAKAWQSWMVEGMTPLRGMGQCDVAALDRNRALADRFRVNGTPAIIFDDGSRFAGAADLSRLSKRLDDVAMAANKKG
jgi:thiol:disulfide interchange protein DsbC